jgi:hypothetical protein
MEAEIDFSKYGFGADDHLNCYIREGSDPWCWNRYIFSIKGFFSYIIIIVGTLE